MADYGDVCGHEGCDQALWAPQSVAAGLCSRHSGSAVIFTDHDARP